MDPHGSRAQGGPTRLSSRDLGILYPTYQSSNWVTRQHLLEAPLVFLSSQCDCFAKRAACRKWLLALLGNPHCDRAHRLASIHEVRC